LDEELFRILEGFPELAHDDEVDACSGAVGCERAADVGVVARERITFNRDGGIAQRQVTPQMQISWDHLYRAFRALVVDDDYVLGRGVQSVSQNDEFVRLNFEDGSEEVADLVIGADGVGSVIRQAVTDEPSPSVYAGYVAWRGLLPESMLPADSAAQLLDRFGFFVMPGSHILGYTVTGPNGETERGARRYNWVWYRRISKAELVDVLTDAEGQVHAYSLAPGQLRESRRQALVEEAAHLLPPPFATAVAAERQPFVQAIFDYEASRMINGRLALLGDAAFVVRPHTAMGVAKAAGDAMAFRSYLARLPYADALPAYQRERLPIGAEIAAYGRRLGASLG